MGVKDRDWYWKKYDEIQRNSRKPAWKRVPSAFAARIAKWLRRWGFRL